MLHKKDKKAILYGKNNYNKTNHYVIIMMSQISALIHIYRNPVIYCSKGILRTNGNWSHRFLYIQIGYVDLGLNPVPAFYQVWINIIFANTNTNNLRVNFETRFKVEVVYFGPHTFTIVNIKWRPAATNTV